MKKIDIKKKIKNNNNKNQIEKTKKQLKIVKNKIKLDNEKYN